MALPKHDATLAWAKTHLGEHEVPWPVPVGQAGSNTGPFVKSCQAATWLDGTGWPWCIPFIVKGWAVAGFKLPYLGAGAYAMLDWYREHEPTRVVPLKDA